MTRAIAVAWVCCTLTGGCASSPPASIPQTYVVRQRDTLYGIAWRHDLDYRDLAKWNHIGPDFRLSVGQVLVLSPTAGGIAARAPPAPSRPAASAGSAGRSAAPSPTTPAARARAQTPPIEESAPGGAPRWAWPTERLSDPRPVPGGGILLLGRLGQDVRAASSGRVVYAGNGLRGYGNLLIIKHGDNLLSAYAHNNDLLVHEGQDVAQGQVIAHMGLGPHQVCALYFEIRVNGKPTDPLPYLAGAP
jgi:lipoprotein NlpD